IKSRATLITEKDQHAVAGDPVNYLSYAQDDSYELPSTSHVSIVDSFGNAVSMTSSIEMAFGSTVMVNGYILNNQLTD
ncbi:gamma-glutamyltransferase, partial [Pseudomonas sp. SIMBA_068]